VIGLESPSVDRSSLLNASDCIDEEWRVVSPLLRRAFGVGCPRRHKARILWDAIEYMCRDGQRGRLAPLVLGVTSYCYQSPHGEIYIFSTCETFVNGVDAPYRGV
jgi:transposase